MILPFLLSTHYFRIFKSQWQLNEDYSHNMRIFDKGHLTPNGDFSKDEKRQFTMITTNIAPQRSAV